MDNPPPLEISSISERRALIIPLSLTTLIICSGLLFFGLTNPDLSAQAEKIGYTAIIFALYGILLVYLLPRHNLTTRTRYAVTAIHACMIAWLFTVENRGIYSYSMVLFIITMIGTVVFTDRWITYVFTVLTVIFVESYGILNHLSSFETYFPLTVFALLITIATNETIHVLKKNIQQQVKRLETLNQITQSLASSIEYHQVITAMTTAIQQALHADTYYIGSSDGQTITLSLLFDEGKFYEDNSYDKANTLAGWVIDHQKSLLLTDLPRQIGALGVTMQTIGDPHYSQSWMGTPLRAHDRQYGLVAVGSYKKNAFDESDLSLLENFVQQAQVSLDNAFHHHEIEKKSTEDSLTGTLNHGYFLKVLLMEAINACTEGYSIGLIMLDIDYFKKYNDQYGHLVGDLILTNLTTTIRQHIKSRDFVGRWGGEEFVIALPHTSGEQALVVANRIRETLANLKLSDRDDIAIIPPTISQGIAVFPAEADQIYSLIDLADQRLYVAKNRGRDQIEPSPISGEGSTV